MENATKALLIAAGVLIGIMLIALFTYMYTNAISMQSSYETSLETNRINQINTKFLKYNGEEVTAQEIVTIANLAAEYKETYGINISVYAPINSIKTNLNSNDKTRNNDNKSKLIKECSVDNAKKTVIHYKVTITMSGNGLVETVTFTQIST